VGRKKLFAERIILSLSTEMLTELDAVRLPDENRLRLIREAIDREIQRRKETPPDGKP
jgi:metal-responsive CopG/Arc/MetJ family transcriptional regulator